MLVILGFQAQGHTTNYFPGPAWIDKSVEYYRASDGATWNTSWNNSLDFGDSKWSNISVGDGFTYIRQSVLRDQVSCINFANEDSVVKRWSQDGPGGHLGGAGVCHMGGAGEKFNMDFDTDEDWHHQAGSDGVPNTVSAHGVATHEFGHAAGGWLTSTGSPGHFTSSADCNWADPPSVQTMCENLGGDLDNSDKWQTIETHDTHEFTAEY